MNDEQFAILAATVEVLGGAVKLLMAGRIKDAPLDQQEQLYFLIQQHLSSQAAQTSPLSDYEAVAFSDLDVHRQAIVKRLMGDVRQLAGLRPAVAPDEPPE